MKNVILAMSLIALATGCTAAVTTTRSVANAPNTAPTTTPPAATNDTEDAPAPRSSIELPITVSCKTEIEVLRKADDAIPVAKAPVTASAFTPAPTTAAVSPFSLTEAAFPSSVEVTLDYGAVDGQYDVTVQYPFDVPAMTTVNAYVGTTAGGVVTNNYGNPSVAFIGNDLAASRLLSPSPTAAVSTIKRFLATFSPNGAGLDWYTALTCSVE
jgi:hypothetical protein